MSKEGKGTAAPSKLVTFASPIAQLAHEVREHVERMSRDAAAERAVGRAVPPQSDPALDVVVRALAYLELAAGAIEGELLFLRVTAYGTVIPLMSAQGPPQDPALAAVWFQVRGSLEHFLVATRAASEQVPEQVRVMRAMLEGQPAQPPPQPPPQPPSVADFAAAVARAKARRE